jgi:hypothetical protein
VHDLEVCGAPVRVGRAPGPPAAALVDTPVWGGAARLVADRRLAHLEVPGLGRVAAEDGALVTVEPATGGDPAAMADLLHGTLAAFVLAQRGEFALHASTVAIGGVGVALAGRSGAGKSTTALALEQRGHRLVTDDVSPLRPPAGRRGTPQDVAGSAPEVGGTEVPDVVPFSRRPHVWPDTAAALRLDLTGSRLITPELMKLSLPPRPGAPVPLRAVVLLRPDPTATRVQTSRLTGLRPVPALVENAYRVRLLARLWAVDLLSWAADLSSRLPVWVLTRPPGGWSADAVADAVEAVGTGQPDRPGAAARPGPAGSR